MAIDVEDHARLKRLTDRLLRGVEQHVDLLVVGVIGRSSSGAVLDFECMCRRRAIGRSWLMWAFMPANANWIG